MKKKLLSCTLAVVLALSVSTTVFATELERQTNSVYGTYEPMADAATVYKVDVAWGSMEFTYNAVTFKKKWNPITHKYDSIPTTEGTWSCETDANKVTVTNHSNKALTATVAARITDTDGGISTKVTGETISLADTSIGAATDVAGTPSVGTASIDLNGELTDTTAKSKSIGTVTVTISDQ